ncbi:MAG TPA: hypothetical protein VFQ87_20765, partial [Bradyrhizobium sp.]|nr:hypothetical protein [Bradyrhizobium sp.]
ERTRAGLTNTVEELRTSVTETANDIRERIRPEAIKAEVSDYIRSRGERLLDDITAAARKNPLQAVAVATTLGYPLLRMVRAIPVPILMVGAGLFLAGSKTAKAATQQASDFALDMSEEAMRRGQQLSEEAMRRGQQLRDEAGQRASAARSYASGQVDRLTGAISSGADRVNRAANDARTTLSSDSGQLQGAATSIAALMADRAAELKEQGLRMAASAADAARDAAADAAATGKKLAGDARERSVEAMRTARDTASDLGGRAGNTLVETIEQHPLLVAGVGLAIGGLIASALPRTTLETGLAGVATGELKRRAQAAAAGGYEAAKSAMSDVVDQATQQMQSEGLGPDGLGRTARDLGQKVRRVAEAAVTTAFDPSQQQQRSNASGDNNHG